MTTPSSTIHRLSISAIFLVAFFAFASGCADKNDTSTDSINASTSADRYSIVTTTGMITDLAQTIAGDRAEITGLMGAGIDPHLYAPTRSDIQTLLAADIVFYNGLLLEGKMTDTLIAHDPGSESIYIANAEALISEINALDAYCERVLETVPANERVLVTAHDAFNYFGRRYNYEVVGIQGISTESEAGVRDIERIVSLLVEKQIKAVFVETTVSERNIRALIAGAEARGHEVVIGGNLFSDAMGAANTYEGTYTGMIDHNVTTITRALGGEAPEAGFSGRLSP